MPDIDGVLFDYGQTLVTFDYPREAILEVLDNFRPTIEEVLRTPAPPADALLENVLLPLEHHVSSTSEDEVAWFDVYRAAWKRAGLALPDGLLYEILDAEQLCWDRIVKVDPGAPRVLGWLRDHGIKRAICSNAPFPQELMRRQVDSNGIGGLMDAVVFSSAVGRRKPASEMYTAALEAIGVSPTRALFVGNRVREDYEGPRTLGIGAILYTAHNAELPPSDIPTIATLAELPGRL
jgi:HAD superfamily hydrolase (TIGR01509 family)